MEQTHSLVLRKNRSKRFLRRSLVLHNLIRLVQPFRLHRMVQRRNPNRMAMPFQLRTMVQHRCPNRMAMPFQLRTMGRTRNYRSTSSSLRNHDRPANDSIGRHRSFGRKGLRPEPTNLIHF